MASDRRDADQSSSSTSERSPPCIAAVCATMQAGSRGRHHEVRTVEKTASCSHSRARSPVSHKLGAAHGNGACCFRAQCGSNERARQSPLRRLRLVHRRAGTRRPESRQAASHLNPVQVVTKLVKNCSPGSPRLTASNDCNRTRILRQQSREQSMKIIMIGGTGPSAEWFHLDDLVRRALEAVGDAREVTTVARARFRRAAERADAYARFARTAQHHAFRDRVSSAASRPSIERRADR